MIAPALVGLILSGISVRANPPTLVAGSGQSATIEIQLDQPPSSPMALTVTANAGAVTGLETVDPQHYRATYRLPDQRYPQVAILLARDRGTGQMGWLAIPIKGNAALELDTKAGATVTVTIQGQQFGPKDADSHGHASMRVVVPPGQHTGIVQSVDRAGNESTKDIDLGAAPFPRMQAAADADFAGGGGPRTVRLEVFAIESDGSPSHAQALSAEVDRGSLSSPRLEAPGLFVVDYRREGGEPGVAHFHFSLAEEPSVVTELALELRAAPAPAMAETRPTPARPPAPPPPVPSPWSASLGAELALQSNLGRAEAGSGFLELAARWGNFPLELVGRGGLRQYARSSVAYGDPAANAALVTDLSGWFAAAGLRFDHPVSERLVLFALVLGGAQDSQSTLTISGGPADGYRQHQTTWGFLGLAGAGAAWAIGPGRALAEVDFVEAPTGGQLSGNAGGVQLGLGYALRIH